MQVDLDALGIDDLVRHLQQLERNAQWLTPLGYRVRTRILESERRLFAERPWPARKPSTLDRYRRPLRSMADDGLHLSPGHGPLDRHGLLRRTLTTAQAPGQRDSVRKADGGLDVGFGVQGRGPVAYGAMQTSGSGGRLARNPFRFDLLAHGEAAADSLDYLLGDFGR